MTRAKSPLKSITLSSGRFRITRVDCAGCIDNKDMNILPSLGAHLELYAWLHEGLHGELPHLAESRVKKAATNLARLLWRVGYRKRRRT